MPRDQTIKKILLIGSGPILIGQAAEFDFSGSQACQSLREEGISVVLVNSNPATIMTDPETADAVYIEPLTPEVIEKIIEIERPDGLIAGFGGQTGLNLTTELAESGALDKYNVKLLGTPLKAIYDTEDRELFKQAMEKIGEPVPRSRAVSTIKDALALIPKLGLPLIVRPAYTLGGAGGGIAYTRDDLRRICELGLKRSRINQVLVEESVLGWKEFEYEVMRDSGDTCITICNMENFDPMGIHTGESIVVTPSQTLSDNEHQMLRSAAINIIRFLGIEGGCNIQFAVKDGKYMIVEVNPRVSRSSALASKATGYPIARVAAKIAIGLNLDEIRNDVTGETPASFEPAIDYVVAKIPRWPFDKFVTADNTLTTAMKSTGEVMAIGRTIEEALLKAVRSLDIGMSFGATGTGTENWTPNETRELLRTPTDQRLFVVYHALRTGFSREEISELTSIDPFFLQKLKNIIEIEDRIKLGSSPEKVVLRDAKRIGLTDERIAELAGITREAVTDQRHDHGILPVYKMVDTCAAEFAAKTPYYYSCYEDECEITPTSRKKVLILGAGPIRIGQGIEFDYCTVHAVMSLREEGIETHIVNNNPETVSTDFDTSDKLFFEPLTLEDVMNIIERERPYGVCVQFGGQTSVNLAISLAKEIARRPDLDTRILGTLPDDMDLAEDRKRFNQLLAGLVIPQPEAGYATSKEEAHAASDRIGYPVLVRPSYVLGGRAMEVVYDAGDLDRYMREAVRVSPDHPVLIDDFLEGAVEIDCDAVSDGTDVLIGAIMEHIEEAGIHSGDSACVIPPQSLSPDIMDTVRDYVKRIALALNVRGLINLQLAAKDGVVYVLEANPRSSRTIPFVSKAVGIPLAKIAAKVIVGKTLQELGYVDGPVPQCVSVKEVLLPFDKLPGADPILGPEMQSTGEVMGMDHDFGTAYYKTQLAAGNRLPTKGAVFLSIRDEDKAAILDVARKLRSSGLHLIGTAGTVAHLRDHGVAAIPVKKVSEGSPNVVDLIRAGKVDLIINTPRSKQGRRDGYEIRRAAVDFSVPYITTIQAAVAAGDAVAVAARAEGGVGVAAVREYHEG